MRITNQWKYAQTMYDYQRGMQGVQKHHMQLSSGLKIQKSYEAAGTYSDAMRLDYEITTLEQVTEATSKSQNFSKNSDKSLQEFSKQLENFKVKLVQAASDIHNTTSLGAIANDLEGIKNHLMNIANTSINGQFLFSGSAVDTKPISQNGSYNGNEENMTTISGSKIDIPFNLNGFDLFLGKDNDYHKTITTNVRLADQTKPDANENPKYLNEESTIKNLIGLNYVKNKDTLNEDHDFVDKNIKFPDTYFYLQGTKTDGTTFTSKFSLTADATMRGFMDKIGQEFGNTATSKVVDVNINNDGQIVVKDLTKGSQNLNMSLVGATQIVDKKDGLPGNAANDPADVKDFVELEKNFKNNSIHITNFTKNIYKDENGKTVDSFDFDKVRLEKKDNTLTTNVSQVNRFTGEFAKDSTRLSEVAGAESLYPHIRNKPDGYNIDGEKINLKINSRNGVKYDITVNLGKKNPSGPVSFSIQDTNPDIGKKGTTITVYNSDEFGQYPTQTDDFTYRQLMDIIGMVASDNIPEQKNLEKDIKIATEDGLEKRKENYDEYKRSIDKSKGAIDVNLDHRGKIVVTDKTQSVTNIDVAIYNDKESGKFFGDSTGSTKDKAQGKGSIFSFMQNNAQAIDEPSIDVFKDLEKMIYAVRNGIRRSDSKNEDPRNNGIQGAIERIDHIMDHINKEKVKIGSYTNLLKETNERASLMKVNVASVKSEVIDADYAESYLSLTQKMMGYQAMLQATSKINQLSLLNYM
ncbi:flagellar hook-associated protein [Campylobacter pinnipediorum subsp. pinnipediorum]|uniref:Flagellin n=1 Tax=Campylobacter pinnipediorum subsp. pinnipediorum TaxID=1660067 RepID=A0AAX0L9U8_9BACT|nr:flagellin [Campylobacter pinnipediorum]AQW81118.1 flagellar hook-associated protein [Campylobacter pinnipediorum subsp. pinnipediorum]OPA77910.1 flagellin biosynthesis protein FlgL [Campylobacter pinnipediorum subsp. pinnipediorum]